MIDRIKAHCMSKPGAYEDHPWGETAFKVAPPAKPEKGKVFCFAGDAAVTVKATLEEQAALIQHPNIEIAHYVGRYGWVTVFLRDKGTQELAIDLIDRSYKMIAP